MKKILSISVMLLIHYLSFSQWPGESYLFNVCDSSTVKIDPLIKGIWIFEERYFNLDFKRQMHDVYVNTIVGSDDDLKYSKSSLYSDEIYELDNNEPLNVTEIIDPKTKKSKQLMQLTDLVRSCYRYFMCTMLSEDTLLMEIVHTNNYGVYHPKNISSSKEFKKFLFANIYNDKYFWLDTVVLFRMKKPILMEGVSISEAELLRGKLDVTNNNNNPASDFGKALDELADKFAKIIIKNNALDSLIMQKPAAPEISHINNDRINVEEQKAASLFVLMGLLLFGGDSNSSNGIYCSACDGRGNIWLSDNARAFHGGASYIKCSACNGKGYK